jgi:hypothetical protein
MKRMHIRVAIQNLNPRFTAAKLRLQLQMRAFGERSAEEFNEQH